MRLIFIADNADHYCMIEGYLYSVNGYNPQPKMKRVEGGQVCLGEVIDIRWRVSEYSGDCPETIKQARTALS